METPKFVVVGPSVGGMETPKYVAGTWSEGVLLEVVPLTCGVHANSR